MEYYTIFVYDIVDNRIRNRIYRMMKKYTIPVQKSVYEAKIDDKLYGIILKKASKILDLETDNLRVYRFKSLTNLLIDNLGIEKYSPFEENKNIFYKD